MEKNVLIGRLCWLLTSFIVYSCSPLGLFVGEFSFTYTGTFVDNWNFFLLAGAGETKENGCRGRIKRKELGRIKSGVKGGWRKRRVSCSMWDSGGMSECHWGVLYCQTWVRVMGTVGLRSSIFHSSQFPQPGFSIPVTRGGRALSAAVWSFYSFILSLIHSLLLSLFHFLVHCLFSFVFLLADLLFNSPSSF